MWRKKTGYGDFLAIVKRMNFLTLGRNFRQYYVWNVETKTHTYTYNNQVEAVNVDTLNKYAESIKGYNELDKIAALRYWVRARNHNATREFRDTRRLYEYEKRLKEYEAS